MKRVKNLVTAGMAVILTCIFSNIYAQYIASSSSGYSGNLAHLNGNLGIGSNASSGIKLYVKNDVYSGTVTEGIRSYMRMYAGGFSTASSYCIRGLNDNYGGSNSIIHAGVYGQNGRGTGSALKVGVYGNASNATTSVGVLGEASVSGSGYSGVFRYRPFVVGNPFGGNVTMYVQPNGGNVGIGTINPAAKLSVNGKIEAEEIEVKDIGADYVFQDEYELQSLIELEKYINENKHLPGIAPASESEKGTNLGEFSEVLLQKIEELTLYVIELKKENVELRSLITDK